MQQTIGNVLIVSAFLLNGGVTVLSTVMTVLMRPTAPHHWKICRRRIVQIMNFTAKEATSVFTELGSAMQLQTAKMKPMKMKPSVSVNLS